MDGWHLCSITRLSYKYCATLTAATTTIVIAPMIVIAITVIIFAIGKANFPSYLMFLRVLSVMSQQPPAAEKYNTLHKMWALPRMADNHALLKVSGISDLPYQVFAFCEIWFKCTSHNEYDTLWAVWIFVSFGWWVLIAFQYLVHSDSDILV